MKKVLVLILICYTFCFAQENDKIQKLLEKIKSDAYSPSDVECELKILGEKYA